MLGVLQFKCFEVKNHIFDIQVVSLEVIISNFASRKETYICYIRNHQQDARKCSHKGIQGNQNICTVSTYLSFPDGEENLDNWVKRLFVAEE